MKSNRLKEPRARFTAVWEFQVSADKRRAFERSYGPNGDWARLFRRGEGYIRTELIRDRDVPGRYVTLDLWTSRLAYQKFRRQNLAIYKALDKRCEALTQNEKLVGAFQKSVPAYLLLAKRNSQSAREKTSAIRQATVKDVPSMIALSREAPSAASWSGSAYREVFNPVSPVRIALVAENEGSVAGFMVARVNEEDCEFENVVVARTAQRKGIGSELIESLVREARNHGAARIFLEVRESNSAARALYKKCGFEISGRRKSYYRDPSEDAVLYILKL